MPHAIISPKTPVYTCLGCGESTVLVDGFRKEKCLKCSKPVDTRLCFTDGGKPMTWNADESAACCGACAPGMAATEATAHAPNCPA